MVGDIETPAKTSDQPQELVPVAGLGALSQALPPSTGAPPGELVLGDLLSDVLLGEVIDISDLIPQILSPAVSVSEITPVQAAQLGQVGGGDVATASDHAAALAILYDDDILASGDSML